MSKYHKSCLRRDKLLEHFVRGIPWSLSGVALTTSGLERLFEAWCGAMTLALITWDQMLLDLGCALKTCTLKRWRDAIGQDADILKFVLAYKEGDAILLEYIERGELFTSTYNRFKHDMRARHHKVSYLCLLAPVISCVFQQHCWHVWYRDVRTALLLLSRFNPWLYLGSSAPAELIARKKELKRVQYESYVDFDVSLPSLPRNVDMPIIEYFAKVFSSLEWSDGPERFDYHFSQGATCTTSRGEWWLNKAISSVNDGTYMSAERRSAIVRIAMTGLGDIPIGCSPVYVIGDATCVPFAVPKNAEKDRVITLEPALLQWFQQGVGNWLLHCIKSSRWTRRHIDFSRAELNKELAAHGAATGDFVTIDLSSASDSLTLAHVNMALIAVPKVAYLVNLARCTHALVGDDARLIRLKKYAGMGNRLTFLLETLFFASLCETAITMHHEDPASSDYRVYGDDIVIEAEYASTMVDLLRKYGFKVNTEKSYFGQTYPPFRESCGGHYLGRYDVTPVILPRAGYKPMLVDKRGRPRGDWVCQSVDLANEFFENHKRTRDWIVAHLVQLPPRLRPLFSDDGSQGVKSSHATNFHLERCDPPSADRKNDYQCKYVRYGALRTTYDHVLSVERLTARLPEIYPRLVYVEYMRQLAIRQDRLDSVAGDSGPSLPLDEGDLLTFSEMARWSPRTTWSTTCKPESWIP